MPDPCAPSVEPAFWQRTFEHLCGAATGVDAGQLYTSLTAHPEAWQPRLQMLGLDAWPAALVSHNDVFAEWKHRRAQEQQRLASRAAELVAALATRGIQGVLLKGHRTRALYPDAAMRPVTDIDLLIAPDDAAGAAETLQQMGYAPCTPRPPRFNFEWTFQSDNAMIVDLHLDLLPYWRIPWDGAEQMLANPDREELHAWHALAHFAQHKGFVKPVQEVDLLLFDHAGYFERAPAPLGRALRLWQYRKLLFWERQPVPRRGLFRCYDAANWAPYDRFWRARHTLIGLAVSTRRIGWFGQLFGVRI